MNDIEMTCERFEERLADYMEGDVQGAERSQMDAHAASCDACGMLVADLRRIMAEAAALPPIEPPAAVWAGIESRITSRVVPIATRRRSIPLVRAIAAAAAMVIVTATATYLATTRFQQPGASVGAQIAQRPTTTTATPSQALDSGAEQSIVRPNAFSPASIERGVPDAASISVRTASREQRSVGRTERAAAVYDEEISRLRTVLKQREDLDPKTIATIQRSLAVIDTAITQARRAVASDPASAFLNKRLADAQNKKVELLRTAAMLPST